jgi:hypothetical protein
MFVLRLPDRGPWAVVGVSSAGLDDRGRPGALAFHGLFVEPRELRRTPLGPFALLGALRSDWGPGTTSLERGTHYVAGLPRWGRGRTSADPTASRVARAILSGKRVGVRAPEPATDLARAVWMAGGRALRRRGCPIATLAYGPDLGFALAAYPRPGLAGPEGSVVWVDELMASPPSGTFEPVERSRPSRRALVVGGLGLAALAAASGVLAWRLIGGRGDAEPAVEGRTGQGETLAPVTPHPAATSPRPLGDPQEERARMAEALADVGSRFGATGATPGDAVAQMRRLADRLRYDGPWLSEAELEHLRRDGRPAAARAVEWHEHLGHFAPGRSLPADLERLAADEQVDALARVFGVEPETSLPPADRVFALADALAAPWPVRPSAELVREYPALGDYGRFLGRLPRR